MWCRREMERSYFASIWVTLDCNAMFPKLSRAFESAKDLPCRQRMSALMVSDIFKEWEDMVPRIPYYADIWKAEQRRNITLDHILETHDTRKQGV